MKKIILIFALACLAGWVNAQQELMISQYMFNGLVLNPAYAGSQPYWSASALHRSQWASFENAPVTQTVCIDGPIANRRFGVGLTVSNDQLGVTKQMEFGLNGAAKFGLANGTLSLGLRFAGSNYTANLSDLTVWDANDPLYDANIQNEMTYKAGFGAYYHEKKWFVGLSIPTLYSSDGNIINDGSTIDRFFKSHYYLNGGMVFEINPSLAIKPSVLLKYQQAAPFQADINCNALFFQKFWLGLGYRSGDAIIAMAEWNITQQLRIGYAYDWTTTAISNYSNGSHEIMLGFDFGKDVQIKARSPRYF